MVFGELDKASTREYHATFKTEAQETGSSDELVLDPGGVTFFDSSALQTTMLCAEIACALKLR